MSRRARRQRSQDRKKRLQIAFKERAKRSLPGTILMHIKSVLLLNKIESTLEYNKTKNKKQTLWKNPKLWLHKTISIEVSDDKIVIDPHIWRSYWGIETVRLADPQCFEIVVEKMRELLDKYEDYKEEEAEKRRRLHDRSFS